MVSVPLAPSLPGSWWDSLLPSLRASVPCLLGPEDFLSPAELSPVLTSAAVSQVLVLCHQQLKVQISSISVLFKHFSSCSVLTTLPILSIKNPKVIGVAPGQKWQQKEAKAVLWLPWISQGWPWCSFSLHRLLCAEVSQCTCCSPELFTWLCRRLEGSLPWGMLASPWQLLSQGCGLSGSAGADVSHTRHPPSGPPAMSD